jgi:hypothetical protein
MTRVEHPWSIPVRFEDVPETGLHLDLSADAATRQSVAVFAGVNAVPQLAVAFDVTRRGNGLHVQGEVHATVVQTCVVSLEPVENEVREQVNLVFSPPRAPALDGQNAADVDPATGDPPEPLIGGVADLGSVAAEFLLLGIDPYPRKPGATFRPPAADDPGAHPFAALAKLKDGHKP